MACDVCFVGLGAYRRRPTFNLAAQGNETKLAYTSLHYQYYRFGLFRRPGRLVVPLGNFHSNPIWFLEARITTWGFASLSDFVWLKLFGVNIEISCATLKNVLRVVWFKRGFDRRIPSFKLTWYYFTRERCEVIYENAQRNQYDRRSSALVRRNFPALRTSVFIVTSSLAYTLLLSACGFVASD